MPNIKLVVEYNGAGFHGFQFQPGLRTVQGELERILPILLREKPTHFVAAGRTDAGVHARGQVINFKVEKMPDLPRLKIAVSSLLRTELSVLSAEVVDDDFHATTSAIGKRYIYTILNRKAPATLDYSQAWWVSAELDLEEMDKQARLLLGEHDFKSFEGAKSQAKSTIKTLYKSEIISKPPYVYYVVEGSGFIKQMVRNIVGTLVQFGKGQIQLPSILDVLEKKDRTAAGMTAPAYGLCMDEVFYPGVERSNEIRLR